MLFSLKSLERFDFICFESVPGSRRRRGRTGLHILLTPLPQVTTLIMASVCLAAMILGRWPERAGAGVVCVNWCASTLGQDHRWWHHGQPAIFALDAAMFAAFVLLAVACRRTWVLWAAACALLLNAIHAAVLLDPRIGQWSYMTALYVWEMGLVFTLAVGAFTEGRSPAGPLRLIQVRVA